MSIQKGTRENMSRVLELVRTTQMQPQIHTIEAPIVIYNENFNFEIHSNQPAHNKRKKKIEMVINLYF